MRASLLAFALLSVASIAHAEWVEVARYQDGSTIDGQGITMVYADAATRTRSGKMVKQWDMVSGSEVKRSGPGSYYVSAKRLVQYECGQRRAKTLSSIRYSEEMGAGKAEALPGPLDWVDLAPGSIGEALYHFACKPRSAVKQQAPQN